MRGVQTKSKWVCESGYGGNVKTTDMSWDVVIQRNPSKKQPTAAWIGKNLMMIETQNSGSVAGLHQRHSWWEEEEFSRLNAAWLVNSSIMCQCGCGAAQGNVNPSRIATEASFHFLLSNSCFRVASRPMCRRSPDGVTLTVSPSEDTGPSTAGFLGQSFPQSQRVSRRSRRQWRRSSYSSRHSIPPNGKKFNWCFYLVSCRIHT